MRSPSVRQETSPSVTKSTPLVQGQIVMREIDLNLTPEDTIDDLVGQEDGDGPVGQEDGDADDPVGVVRKNLLVSNEKRRAIFEALLGRARSGHLKRSETREVSVQFSVPIRTIQHIWKKGKGYLDQGLGVDVSVNTKKWYRKETDLWAEFGKESPFGRKFSSKHSVKMPAVGSTPSFGRRAVLRSEEEAFENT
jgi:hypothetical protein